MFRPFHIQAPFRLRAVVAASHLVCQFWHQPEYFWTVYLGQVQQRLKS